MYGLISLHLAYAIYLVIFFRTKKRNALYKKITILLGIKLVILTTIYFAFFSHKMTNQNIQKVILTQN